MCIRDSTVGAIVEARQRVPADRMVEEHAPAGGGEVLEIAVPGGEAADGVHDHVDLDAGLRPLREYLEETRRELAALEYVGLDVDAVRSFPDRRQLRLSLIHISEPTRLLSIS